MSLINTGRGLQRSSTQGFATAAQLEAEREAEFEAMKMADSTDPKIFSSQISKINYLGVTGPISFDKFGDVKNAALTIFSFQDGNKFPIEVVKSSGS